MPIVFVKDKSRKSITPSAFKNEEELETAVAEHHSLLTGTDEPALALVQRQVELANAGVLDVLFVDATGYPVAVEVKLGRNIQSRREVVAQAFDYTSDLSQMTVDELDDLVSGSLEKALSSFDPQENRTQFETRWKACGANLRAGKIRLVIVVDESREDLSRIVQYIGDHSDLDVRLVSVQKFEEADGGMLYVPNTLVKGGIIAQVRSAPCRGRQEFVEIVKAYDKVAPEGMKCRGNAADYRWFPLMEWSGVSYEFYAVDGGVYAELYIEKIGPPAIKSVFQRLAPIVAKAIPYAETVFDPNWWEQRGSIRVKMPWDTPPDKVATAMLKLIELTRAEITAELAKLRPAN